MKNYLLAVLVIFSLKGFAQDNDDIKTIFGNLDVSGGFGGISVRYSDIGNKDAFISGARGGWVINRNIAMGGGGYSFQSEMINDDNINYKCRIIGGYGGVLVEPVILPKSVVHITLPTLIGVGGISYRVKAGGSNDVEDWKSEDRSAFMVFEPGIEIEINVVKFMRIGFGAYYRLTSNVDIDYENTELGAITDSDILNGFSAGITCKFGKF